MSRPEPTSGGHREPGARPPPLLPLAVEGLSYEAAGKRLLQDIDLQVMEPGVTVVMGPNGAGKSLLLRLLHGLIEPTAGRIRWGGQAPGDSVRARQAMVFQRAVLLRRSVAANLEFVLRLRGGRQPGRCAQLLEHVGLSALARRPARKLSGGEQQRLALARALAPEPEVLLLDEPTSSLDPASVAAIEAIVHEASRGGTKVVFVTHDVGQAKRLAAEVVFLDRGRLAEHTPAAQFFERPASGQARAYLAGHLIL